MDLSPFPTIERIEKELMNYPAFVAAHPSNQPDFPEKMNYGNEMNDSVTHLWSIVIIIIIVAFSAYNHHMDILIFPHSKITSLRSQNKHANQKMIKWLFRVFIFRFENEISRCRCFSVHKLINWQLNVISAHKQMSCPACDTHTRIQRQQPPMLTALCSCVLNRIRIEIVKRTLVVVAFHNHISVAIEHYARTKCQPQKWFYTRIGRVRALIACASHWIWRNSITRSNQSTW